MAAEANHAPPGTVPRYAGYQGTLAPARSAGECVLTDGVRRDAESRRFPITLCLRDSVVSALVSNCLWAQEPVADAGWLRGRL